MNDMDYWEKTNDRPSFDSLGMETARLWSSRSSDAKRKIGACILDSWNRVVGVGYNGRAVGEPNERESMARGHSGFIHAEVNALLAANWNGKDHTLYVTLEPCFMCARLIVNSRRIARVVFGEPYVEADRVEASLPSSASILAQAGIETFLLA